MKEAAHCVLAVNEKEVEILSEMLIGKPELCLTFRPTGNLDTVRVQDSEVHNSGITFDYSLDLCDHLCFLRK